MDVNAQKKQDAVRALINIAVIEGFVLVAVVGVFLYTQSLTYLIGGVVGSTLIFGPMFLRWTKDHAPALRPSADETGGGRD